MTGTEIPLVPFPSQPASVPWPDAEWPVGDVAPGVDLAPLLDAAFDNDGPLATSYAVVVVHHGRIVAERYAGQIEHFDAPAETIGHDTRLLSWSMAKSMLHAVVGILVADGRLDVAAVADVPEWRGVTDGRESITLDDLLAMRDGLDFVEDYVDARVSDVIEMLFGSGIADVAHFAADRELVAPPDTRFNYSSGTTNIISGIVAHEVGAGDDYEAFVRSRLFDAIGMTSPAMTFDEAGTWIASSYVHAAARDFARFGLLYLRGGRWGDAQVLPSDWIDHGRRKLSVDAEGSGYGHQWWVVDDEYGTFRASGYEGQTITICPAHDLVFVRLGKTSADRYPDLKAWRAAMVAAFA